MKKYLSLILLAAPLAWEASAATIGNWSGSHRSWNQFEFSSVKATMIGASHTVEADGAISAANLANDDVFIVGEALAAPTASELADLNAWVTGGGILAIFSNSNFSGGAGGNAILSALGSSMSLSASFVNATGPLAGGNFASEGPPYNIAGQNIAVSPGNTVSGGNTLYGIGIHYEQIGNGWVFAFGDRFDHNFASPNAGNNNGKLFLNLVNGGGDQNVPDAGATSLLLALALMSLRFCNSRVRQ